jgi:hypothetical protein
MTLHRTSRTGLALAALVVTVSSLFGPAPAAQAIGSTKGCRVHEYNTHTNDWSYFWSHKIRMYERVCVKSGHTRTHSYAYLRYVRRPTVALVSRGRPSTERVRVTKRPYVTQRRYIHGRLLKVRWTFMLRSCSLWAICNDWEFTFHVATNGTTICVEKGNDKRTCDAKKYF